MRALTASMLFASASAAFGVAPSGYDKHGSTRFDQDQRGFDKAELEGWVEGKLQSMSLREKIGQMVMIDIEGFTLTRDLVKHLNQGSFGNIIFFEKNLKSTEQAKSLIRQLQDVTIVKTGVPLLTAVDQEGGPVNRLGIIFSDPSMQHSARTVAKAYEFRPNKAMRILRALWFKIGRQMKAIGFNMNLAPVLDLTSEEKSYIYDRSFGSDPKQVIDITKQFIKAMDAAGVISTGKHFPNLSKTLVDSHQTLPVLQRSLQELQAHEFLPFQSLRRQLNAVMVGHVLAPALDPKFPTSISPRAIEVLRRKVGFRGVIISDDLKMKALTENYPFYEIVLRAIFADIDLLIVAWSRERQIEAVDIIERATRTGALSQERIDRSVRRILALKFRYAR